MTRLEIIANNTVEEDIQDALKKIEADFGYTRLNNVHGRGHSDPKEGNAVWPEENFVYIIYAEDHKAMEFVDSLRQLKEKFTKEGVKIFALPYVSPVEL